MSSRHYSYRITVTPTGAPDATAPLPGPLSFEATNHDDILALVERALPKTGLKPNDNASVMVGLKLLGEVVLKEKSNPLFDPLREGIRAFIMSLKARKDS